MSGASAICGFVSQTSNKINVVRATSAKIYHTHWRSISLDSVARYPYAGYKKAAPSQLVNQANSLLGNLSIVVSVIESRKYFFLHESHEKNCEFVFIDTSNGVT